MPQNISVLDILDIILISIIAYNILLLIKDTPAAQIIKGFIILFIFSFISNWIGLRTINCVNKRINGYAGCCYSNYFSTRIKAFIIKDGQRWFLINFPLFPQEEEIKNGKNLLMD